ncbi:hypothetical protein GRJ2_001436300 [Grus japonensis]|uniref:Uncharacterized protein n=1 Tax=Grus japonensis TaxID=30415 RepID=A0ABC9WWK3_GRUJA
MVNWRGKQFVAMKAGLDFRGTLDELEEWAKRNLLKFSKDKHCVLLSPSQNNQVHELNWPAETLMNTEASVR